MFARYVRYGDNRPIYMMVPLGSKDEWQLYISKNEFRVVTTRC
jgi:hypothetical protein